MLLAAAWLQIPDSHTWQFVFSMLSGVLLVVGFCWLYTATFHHLRPCAEPASAMAELVDAVVVHGTVVAAAAGRLLSAGRTKGSMPGIGIHNRRHGCGIHLGYSSLVAWQERIYDCLQWLWAGLLLPLAIELCACGIHKRVFASCGCSL